VTPDVRGPDPELRRALTAGFPDHAPEGLLEAIAQRTATRDQRRPRRWSLILGLAAAVGAAAGIAVVVVAVLLQLGPGNVGTGSTTPLATMPPPPSIPADGSCEPDVECLGLIPAGEGASKTFQPTLRFRLPDGWMNRVDQVGVFELRPVARPGDVLGLYRNPVPVRAGRLVTGLETARQLADWLAADPELSVGGIGGVSVGGLSGWSVTLSPAPRTAKLGADCPGVPCVSFFTATDPSPRPTWSYRLTIPEQARMRIYLLDAPDGVVVISVLAWDGSTLGEVTQSTTAIIDSFRFATR
jgi:hypothetical protein